MLKSPENLVVTSGQPVEAPGELSDPLFMTGEPAFVERPLASGVPQIDRGYETSHKVGKKCCILAVNPAFLRPGDYDHRTARNGW